MAAVANHDADYYVLLMLAEIAELKADCVRRNDPCRRLMFLFAVADRLERTKSKGLRSNG